ncbi:host-nuclease inhibitor Gam family protein [Sporolactobacillus sp. CQH2019]|uniref:host-nuclease inhibitor Gam family protein n=1 Tax=Sporolactobacillus sp. CQH2019 TaxID=3023512 RepID=UPI0023689372|nr:host-nuclease inhibitor Gam family protein [Sporolactobacillus sp. CQH2019]MDD9147851.1 host-nuclease inhibitor Gam family protein [Sporolactobacillus sp. CQH2019]
MAMEQESLQEYLDKQQGVTQPGFVVDDDRKAEWALRKLAVVKAQQGAVKTEAEEQIQVIEQWENEQVERLNKDVEYFTSMLIGYVKTKRANDPKFKTLKLPHGKIGFRKQQPKWQFSEDAIDRLKQAGYTELIRIKEELDKAKIKKRFAIAGDGTGIAVDKDTGEVFPFIVVEQQEDKPIVEAN